MATRPKEDEPPPVSEVVSKLREFEDYNLALSLQEQEFGHHYNLNRTERKIMGVDTKKSKEEQMLEKKYALEKRVAEAREIAIRDEEVARQFQREIEAEEARRKVEQARIDEELAKRLQLTEGHAQPITSGHDLTEDERIARELQERYLRRLNKPNRRLDEEVQNQLDILRAQNMANGQNQGQAGSSSTVHSNGSYHSEFGLPPPSSLVTGPNGRDSGFTENLNVTITGQSGQKKIPAGGTTIGLNESQQSHRPLVFPNHPECPKRIEKILERLEKTRILEACQIVKHYPNISLDNLLSFHSEQYIEKIRSLSTLNQDHINTIAKNFDSVQLCPATFEAALDGISCCGYLAQLIQEGQIPNGFAIVRPPGHHALHDEANGFCIFNNVVHAAKVALGYGAKRVLIVDFDVHHGQSTQRAFYKDPRVTYFSIHRYENGLYWPHLEESNFNFIGEDEGRGYNINVPINETHAKDADYNFIFWNILFPIAEELNPDFVLFSAGFDSCMGDPLGQMDISPLLYPHWIYHLAPICKGKILVVLEGGYHHEMLAIGVEKCMRVLLGELPETIEFSSEPKESTILTCLNVISVLKDYWTNLGRFSKKWAE
uniref:histone deacetylase n=1 Tax=Acrobeloides nanus TaxID=290746 RepID=A0A914C1U8_9BILA